MGLDAVMDLTPAQVLMLQEGLNEILVQEQGDKNSASDAQKERNEKVLSERLKVAREIKATTGKVSLGMLFGDT